MVHMSKNKFTIMIWIYGYILKPMIISFLNLICKNADKGI